MYYVKELQEKIRSALKEILVVDPNSPDFLIGSYKQHTAINKIADVDMMIPLDPNQYGFLAQNKPELAINFVAEKLKEKFGAEAKIVTYDTCIRLKKEGTNTKVDIVPSFRNEGSGGGWLIPDVGKKRFIHTNPRFHQELLSQQNEKMNGKLIPLIKKLKTLNTTQNWNLESSYISTKLTTELNTTPRDSRHALREGLKILATSTNLKSCRDPGVEKGTIKNNLPQQKMDKTHQRIKEAYQQAKNAKRLEEGNKTKSLEMWEKIAGKEFYD